VFRALKVPVDVRATLARTPVRGTPGIRPGQCYARFWLQPQVYLAGLWQGGESFLVRRDAENAFKIGCLPLMTLEQAAQYVERELERCGMPFMGSQPWEHPFTYSI
jgi:hypothetical protein